MTERDLDGHIAEIRGIYAKKAALMLSELDAHMPKCVKYTRPEGGLFLWCTLPERLLPDSYASLFVKEWASRRSDWLTPSDFDNMIETWQRVKDTCGIED